MKTGLVKDGWLKRREGVKPPPPRYSAVPFQLLLMVKNTFYCRENVSVTGAPFAVIFDVPAEKPLN